MSDNLTPRQQEIVDLQKQGMKPSEIAKALKITDNAVYQQIRRMRGGAPKKSAAKSGPKSGAKASAPATSASSSATYTNSTNTSGAVAARPLTPLQSLRARRDEISVDIKQAVSERDAAQKALAKAQEYLDKIQGRHADEMARLDAAEHALKGTVPETPETASPAPLIVPGEITVVETAKTNGSDGPPRRKTAAQAVAEKEKKAKEGAAAKAAAEPAQDEATPVPA